MRGSVIGPAVGRTALIIRRGPRDSPDRPVLNSGLLLMQGRRMVMVRARGWRQLRIEGSFPDMPLGRGPSARIRRRRAREFRSVPSPDRGTKRDWPGPTQTLAASSRSAASVAVVKRQVREIVIAQS